MSYQNLIKQLQLERHPEGGYYRETYRSDDNIANNALPERYGSDHSYSTAIYFLLPSDQVSAFHRIQSDEIFHFYCGSPLTIHMISPKGQYSTQSLGIDFAQQQQPQIVIPRNHWFGATVDEPESFTLIGCTVAPSFEFEDFELAEKASLITQYPQHKAIIEQLT